MEPTAAPASTPPETPQPTTATAMDVVAAPPSANDGPAPAEAPANDAGGAEQTKPADADTKPRKLEVTKTSDSKPAKPKNNGSSVTLAIVSTVIIVLGLAALAVLAYINQPK
ncbi:MAG: hypothetical protein AAB462_01005 [Patescibacteria group bacterium]